MVPIPYFGTWKNKSNSILKVKITSIIQPLFSFNLTPYIYIYNIRIIIAIK